MLIFNICTYHGFLLCLKKYILVCLFQQYLHVKRTTEKEPNFVFDSENDELHARDKAKTSFVLSNSSKEESAAKCCV